MQAPINLSWDSLSKKMCLPWNILSALHLKKVLPHRAEFFSDWTLKNADDATVSLLIGFMSYK